MRKILFFISLCLFACRKDNGEYVFPFKDEQACYEATPLGCNAILDSNYVYCNLDGKDFCRSKASNDYYPFGSVLTSYVTAGPTLMIGDPATFTGYIFEMGLVHKSFLSWKKGWNTTDFYYQPYLVFGVNDTLPMGPGEFIEKYLQPGELPIGAAKQSYGKWDVTMRFPCEPAGVTVATYSQPQPGSYLRCTRLEKTETPTHYIYDITLEFSLYLYRPASIPVPAWRKATNGKMNLRIPVLI